MRNEVFEIPAPPVKGEMARIVDIEGDPWWLLVDIVTLRSYDRQVTLHADLLDRIPEAEMEQVWVLEPAADAPCARWVLSADGASVAHDVLASETFRAATRDIGALRSKRRRRPMAKRRGAGRPPGFLPRPDTTDEEG